MTELPLSWYLALRYLRSTRRDAFVTFLCLITATGITVGVAALILVLAALAGFQDRLLADVLARSPKLEISLPPGLGAAAAEDLAARVRRTPGVGSVQQVLYGQGWLRPAAGLDPRPVEFVGFERELPEWFPGAPEVTTPGLVVPRSLAVIWGLEGEDAIQLLSPRPTLTPIGPQPRMAWLPLAGTYEEGRSETAGARVALPMSVAARLLQRSDVRLDIAPSGSSKVEDLAAALAPLLPSGAEVRSWRELNRALLFVLRLERGILFLAVALIVLVASFALVASLAMLMTSRRSEIGLLRALGTPPQLVQRVFLLVGGGLAAAGSIAGGSLGVLGAWSLDRYGVLRLPGDVYIVDHVPFLVRVSDLSVVLVATVVLTLAASVWSARKVPTLGVVEALHS